MEIRNQTCRRAAPATLSLLLASSMALPIVAGCGDGTSQTGSNAQPPLARQQGYGNNGYGAQQQQRNFPQQQPQQRRGMSTGQKVALLTGAAALWYMYNRNKNNQGTGAQGKYYRSKNGRIYYRDAQGQAVYVTPPAQGIQVPADVAERYNRAAQQDNFGMIENDRIGGPTGAYQGDGYGSQGYGGRYDDPRGGNSGSLRGPGEYGGSGYGAPYGADTLPSGAGAGSAAPPGPRGGGF